MKKVTIEASIDGVNSKDHSPDDIKNHLEVLKGLKVDKISEPKAIEPKAGKKAKK